MKTVQNIDTASNTRPHIADNAARVPKVALFTDSDVFAGTERHVLDLAEGLRDLGAFVQVACPSPAPLAEISRGREIPVLAIPKGGLMDWVAIRKLRALFRSGELDLVHAHNGRTALSSVLAKSWAGTGCCIFTQHFVEPGRLKCGRIQRGVKALVHRFVNRRIDRFIAISAAVRDAMVARVDSAPVPINNVRSSGTSARACATSAARSDSSRRAASPVDPVTTMPHAPAARCARMFRENVSRSTSPVLPNVVTTGARKPRRLITVR